LSLPSSDDLFSQLIKKIKSLSSSRNAPILVVHGRQHPVNIRHVSQSQDDWQAAILSTIFQIHRDAQPQ
jgi:HrpA-like RNA helicase